MSPTKYDETPIEELNLTGGSYNGLKREGVDDIGRLARMTDEELLQIRDFGTESIKEIRSKLAEY